MVGTGTDDPDVDAVPLIPASKAIDHIDAIARVEVVDGTLAVDSPDLSLPVSYIYDVIPRDGLGQDCGESWDRVNANCRDRGQDGMGGNTKGAE